MKNKLKLFLGMALFITGVTTAQVGINTTSPQGALDITSTSGGLLVPRMTSAQRDLVTVGLPQNGMLIFNTTNNTFEVFKSTCSCWVTVNDGGDTPASSLVNTPPTAYNLTMSGSFLVGKTATLGYTYADAQNDAQGLTTIEWQRASTYAGGDPVTIAGATSATYTFQAGDLGTYIRARVFPRAATGVLNGAVVATGWTLVEASTVPTANNLVVTGTTAVGNALTASYTFAGGNGTENTTPTTFGGTTSGTQYFWQSANTAAGEGTNNVNLYGAFAYTNTYTSQNDLLGKFIRVAVRAKDTNDLQATNWVYSPWVGPLTAATEVAPVASNVTYSPTPAVGLLHTASYSYYDVNFDPEGASTFQWYRADDVSGTGAVPIAGATSLTYTGQGADGGKFIGFGVTPKALTGTTTGTEVRYYNPSTVAPVAEFTFTASGVRQLPFFHAGRIMNNDNAIQVEITVTSPGGISFSTNTSNGYSFSGNTTLANGTHWVTLAASGTQTGYDSLGDSFTITGIGQTTLNKSFIINHVKFGSDFTTHYNGWVSGSNVNNALASYTSGETFNNNSQCISKLISASACPPGNTFTSASGKTYETVLINGQCWMKQNLDEIPSNYTTLSPWLNAAATDSGQYGYYNAGTTNGSAGWASSEPATNRGRLYQWSAAMNGATSERAQGACPTGWHVPSDCEWKFLEHGIGMKISDTNALYFRAGIHPKLFSVGTGSGGNAGTNSSGFSILFSGSRDGGNGSFANLSTSFGIWLSSSPSGPSWRGIDSTIYSSYGDGNRAFSVRCLRD